MTNPLTVDATPLTSTDQLLNIFDELAYEWTEEDSIDVDGVRARSFAVQSPGFTRTLLISRPDVLALEKSGWFAAESSHVWVIEHPERCLLYTSDAADE